jgi:uncharacterized protein (DUF983 family)
MFVVKCPTCGKKTVWDDFQPTDIRCGKCGERLNVHKELKRNISVREQTDVGIINYCPHCRGVVRRRWFIKCPNCNYWLLGPFSFYDKLAVTLLIGVVYIIFSVIYLVYFH